MGVPGFTTLGSETGFSELMAGFICFAFFSVGVGVVLLSGTLRFAVETLSDELVGAAEFERMWFAAVPNI